MNAVSASPITAKQTRNTGIDCLKVIAILLVVISHVTQTLCEPSAYVASMDYIVPLENSTTNFSYLVLTLLRHTGMLGNDIFFFCSAWYLLESTGASACKIVRMAADVWVISVLFLAGKCLVCGGGERVDLIVKALTPNYSSVNWYLTTYMLFYAVHPLLNKIIAQLDQKGLLRVCTCFTVLYIIINIFDPFAFYGSFLMNWVAFYFDIAYVKRYALHIVRNRRFNRRLLAAGTVGMILFLLLLNLAGLLLTPLDGNLLIWSWPCNPFLLMITAALLNLALGWKCGGPVTRNISGCSYLIYIIHDNLFVRLYLRPWIWQWVHTTLGYDWVLLWEALYVAGLFLIAWLLSVLYQHTLQKLVRKLSDRIVEHMAKCYQRYTARILAKTE